jgi:hypothetical protein
MPTPKLNGLELLKRVKDGIFPHPTMAATIPMKIIAVEKGAVEQTHPAHERIVHRKQSEPLTQSNEGRTREMREEEGIIADYREGGFGKRLNLYLGYRSLRKEFLEIDRSEIAMLRQNQSRRPGFRLAFRQFMANLLSNT